MPEDEAHLLAYPLLQFLDHGVSFSAIGTFVVAILHKRHWRVLGPARMVSSYDWVQTSTFPTSHHAISHLTQFYPSSAIRRAPSSVSTEQNLSLGVFVDGEDTVKKADKYALTGDAVGTSRDSSGKTSAIAYSAGQPHRLELLKAASNASIAAEQGLGDWGPSRWPRPSKRLLRTSGSGRPGLW